ncbi:MAG: hypothetical protein AB1445_09910 [Bacillota bacterium]
MVHERRTVGLSGAGSAQRYLGTTWEVGEEQLAAWLLAGQAGVSGCTARVLVSHTPRWGLVDAAWNGNPGGSRAGRQFVDAARPDLVLCGHIHEARGVVGHGPTTVVNCGPGHRGSFAAITLAFTGGGDLVRVNLHWAFSPDAHRFPRAPGEPGAPNAAFPWV